MTTSAPLNAWASFARAATERLHHDIQAAADDLGLQLEDVLYDMERRAFRTMGVIWQGARHRLMEHAQALDVPLERPRRKHLVICTGDAARLYKPTASWLGAAVVATALAVVGPALDDGPQAVQTHAPDPELAGALALWDVEARHACAAQASQPGGYVGTGDGGIVCAQQPQRQLVAQGSRP